MARPTTIATAVPYNLKLSGIDLHDYGVVSYTIPNLGMATLETIVEPFPDRHTAFVHSATFQPQPFAVTGVMVANSVADLMTNLDLLKRASAGLKGANFTVPAPVRLEVSNQTDRYYPCIYTGGFSVGYYGQQPTLARHVLFTLPLLRIHPFAIATTPTIVTPGGAAESFLALDLGTAPSWPLVEIKASGGTPGFTLADMFFYCDFDYPSTASKVLATDINGNTIQGASGAATLMDQYDAGDFGKGRYEQEASFATEFASTILNNDEGTMIAVVRPQFAYDTAANKYLIEWYDGDSSDKLTLWYEDADDKWLFTRTRASSGVTVGSGASAAQSFASDDYMVLAFSWGADGMKIYKDGVLLDSNATTTGPAESAGTLNLGDDGDAAIGPAKWIYLFGYPYQMSNDDVKRASLNPEDVTPYNVQMLRTSTLTANVRVVLDFEKGSANQHATTGARSNDISNWTHNGWPMLRPNHMCFYVPTSYAQTTVKLTYRKEYL